MVKIIKTLFCTALTILLLSAGDIKAIELVKWNIAEYSSSGSIIRNYKDDLNVVCHHNSIKPIFLMFTENSPISYVIYLDEMDTVYDFEIYNDTVYFCGEGNIDQAGAAVIGYFAVSVLLNLTPANVSYINLPLMSMVRKIEVDQFASRKHVVGIGESVNFKGMMVDMIDESSYWKLNFGDVGGDSASLSDLAITRSYIVVTSTIPTAGFFTTGRLWYINKPSIAGQSIFPCGFYYYDNDINVGMKYLIKHTTWDSFVTAYHRYYNKVGTNPFVVSYYTGYSHDRTLVINEASENRIELGDINHTFGSWTVALLVYGLYETNAGVTPRSVIYEIPNTPSAPTTLMAHVYDGIFFESIDQAWVGLSLDYQHFVLTGYEPYGYGTPYYMKFHSLFFDGNCLNKKDNTVKEMDITPREGQATTDNIVTLQVPTVRVYDIKLVNFVKECISQT